MFRGMLAVIFLFAFGGVKFNVSRKLKKNANSFRKDEGEFPNLVHAEIHHYSSPTNHRHCSKFNLQYILIRTFF